MGRVWIDSEGKPSNVFPIRAASLGLVLDESGRLACAACDSRERRAIVRLAHENGENVRLVLTCARCSRDFAVVYAAPGPERTADLVVAGVDRT